MKFLDKVFTKQRIPRRRPKKEYVALKDDTQHHLEETIEELEFISENVISEMDGNLELKQYWLERRVDTINFLFLEMTRLAQLDEVIQKL